jgi:anthranilate synthase component 1
LLESVEKGRYRSRYSTVVFGAKHLWRFSEGKVTTSAGVKPCDSNIQVRASLEHFIQQHQMTVPEQLPPSSYGVFGYMGYDMVRLEEQIPDDNQDVLGVPDSIFFAPEFVVAFDSVEKKVFFVTAVFPDGSSAVDAYESACNRLSEVIQTSSSAVELENEQIELSEPVSFDNISSNTTCDAFMEMVDQAKKYIYAGDIFQVVLSQRFSRSFSAHPFELYKVLRSINPSPYSFYLKLGEFSLVGSSPEILVKVSDGKVMLRPIAGTRWRGDTEEEDKRLAEDLLADKKEISEHLMLLDLGRNDVGRVAKVGSVEVTEQMVIEYYSHVMHIVSHVEGTMNAKTALDAWFAGFPAGTVSGAPKVRAMEIIDELENIRRSFYAGGVGYFSSNGEMDSCITLRTALIKDNMLYVQAGGGVVADSDPLAEYQESCNKAKAVLAAAQYLEK